MKRLLFLAGLLSAGMTVAADNLVWYDGTKAVTYHVEGAAAPVVATAASLFADDMQQVTGQRAVSDSHATIRLYELDRNPQAATRLRGMGIPVDSITERPDAFYIGVHEGRILVVGSNGRGCAYGILELSRMAGVSPWVWWGDVVPERKSRLAMSDTFSTLQQPSVEYRGIFLNDEDWSLRPWSCQTYEPGPKGRIGAKTYKRIFQLLLRLRGNAVWPAMHEGTTAFFQTPDAKAMADSCGIVVGTSHCEPLLRNNVGEWDTAVRGRFNYRTNRQAVIDYWTERLEEVKHSRDNMFTIGMRGIHDSSMEGYRTEQEKFDALQQVIDDQQQLLSKHIGDPSRLMQVFVPYKEVLQLYERGLRVPDYVTLMWCDDNYGYMTRYSSPSEQQRSGGGGIYYHLSYWGRPHDYLWLTTTQPGLIYNELREAYDRHVRKLWIANVHDPKVAGYDLELFLDMAWNIESVNGSNLCQHYRRWLCRQFGTTVGERLFPAMHDFYRLCGERRPEFMGWTQVELDKKKYHRGLSPVTAVGLTAREAQQRLDDFRRITNTVDETATLLRPELRDAYFAAIAYPVKAAAAMSRKILSDSTASHAAYQEIQALTRQYNQLADGKWKGLMDAAPRQLPVFGDVRATLAADTLGSRMVIVRNASDFDSHTGHPTVVQMLGHSMQAVALPKGAALTYTFSIADDDDYVLTTAVIPTHPVDNGDVRYTVSIDGQQPLTYSLKEPFRSERWKQNVLAAQTTRSLTIHLTAGTHTMTIEAIDSHIVADQWSLARKKHAEKTP